MADANERLELLLSQLTLPDTVALLSGKNQVHTASIPKHDIPSLRFSDGPSGVRGSKVFLGAKTTAFPCGISLAATWDTGLLEEVGKQMALQAKAKGVHVILAPTINIHRTPLGGRTFESYSEDPLLSGYLAAGYVRGMQQEGVASTIKHFICNDQETERMKIDVVVEKRPLREIYLKPFQIALREAKPWAVMASYNRVNGLHASESPQLLNDILRVEWGWDGLIMSDWYATYSTAAAMKAGLDLEMPGPPEYRGKLIRRAIGAGKLDMTVVKDRARNVLKLIEKTRALGIPEDAPEGENDSTESREVNRRAAREGIVLLKNDAGLLPIRKPGRLAVIGPNANDRLFCGGGSSTVFPYYYVSPLDGIKEAASDVTFSQGCFKYQQLPLVDLEAEPGRKGMKLEFFDKDFQTEPDAQKQAEIYSENARLYIFDCVPKGVGLTSWLRATGIFKAPATGKFEFGIITSGRAKLFIDGALLVNNWDKQEQSPNLFGYGTVEVKGIINLQEGKQYKVEIVYHPNSTFPERSAGDMGLGGVKLGASQIIDPAIALADAVKAATEADTVILCVGTDSEWESESFDRKDMKLPSSQDELVQAILKANKQTIVVNISGSPIEMPWIDDASTVLQTWFSGSELGRGLADVLFGKVSPSGKLPTTFPRLLEQNPSFGNFPGENGRVKYAEGLLVGYRHYTTRHIPTLFPFGHGLSYTSFVYSDLAISSPSVGAILEPNSTLHFSLNVLNNGSFLSHEIVQIYISGPVKTSVFRPSLELQGFEKVKNLKPGEMRSVAFKLDKYAVSYYDEVREEWVAEAGDYEMKVGASVEDLRVNIGFNIPTTFSWTGL